MSVDVANNPSLSPPEEEQRSGLPPPVWGTALIFVLTILLIWQLRQ